MALDFGQLVFDLLCGILLRLVDVSDRFASRHECLIVIPRPDASRGHTVEEPLVDLRISARRNVPSRLELVAQWVLGKKVRKDLNTESGKAAHGNHQVFGRAKVVFVVKSDSPGGRVDRSWNILGLDQTQVLPE